MGQVYTALCQPRINMKKLSQNSKNRILRDNQVGVVSLLVINWILTVLIVIASLIPDFAFNNGGAYPHVVWAVAGMTVTLFGLLGQGFNVNVNAAYLVRYLRVSIIVIILAIAANIVHGVFSIIEIANCTSALCTNASSPSGYAFLIVSIVFSFTFPLLYFWLWWRTAVFANNVESAILYGWRPGVWEDRENQQIANRMPKNHLYKKLRK